VQKRGLSARLSYDGGGVVAADIEESAKSAVVAADNDDGFSGDGGRDELSRRLHLFGACDQLPRFTEYAQTLEFGDAGIGIPRGGNG